MSDFIVAGDVSSQGVFLSAWDGGTEIRALIDRAYVADLLGGEPTAADRLAFAERNLAALSAIANEKHLAGHCEEERDKGVRHLLVRIRLQDLTTAGLK